VVPAAVVAQVGAPAALAAPAARGGPAAPADRSATPRAGPSAKADVLPLSHPARGAAG